MFIENMGQYDPKAKFVVHGAMGIAQLAQDTLWLTLFEPEIVPEQVMSSEPLLEADQSSLPKPTPSPYDHGADGGIHMPRKGVNLQLQFIGANLEPEVVGFDPLETKVFILFRE